MGLLSENNDPYVFLFSCHLYLREELIDGNDSKNKGDMHEAFNMGLDPSVDASAFVQDVKEGELRHSENLWPDKKDWQGADDFVSCNMKLMFLNANCHTFRNKLIWTTSRYFWIYCNLL